MAETDLYLLNASPPATMPPLGSELDLDVALTPAPPPTNRVVQGTVFDPTNTPVAGATVKVLSGVGDDPVTHVNTNASGQYIINTLAPGTYVITAKATGFTAPSLQTFTLPQTGDLELNITLLPLPVGLFINAIYGIVRESGTNTAIENALVTVNNIDAAPVLFATTTTSVDGEYVIGNLPPGTYSVQATANGFNVSSPITIPISPTSFASANILLIVNPIATLGTVSGRITDTTTGLAVPFATVGLYSVDLNGTETLIDFTQAQADGLYLFTNVQPNHTYLVKAKLVQFT